MILNDKNIKKCQKIETMIILNIKIIQNTRNGFKTKTFNS